MKQQCLQLECELALQIRQEEVALQEGSTRFTALQQEITEAHQILFTLQKKELELREVQPQPTVERQVRSEPVYDFCSLKASVEQQIEEIHREKQRLAAELSVTAALVYHLENQD
eukprot:TRINITY_DN82810_c0_g1_i1.p1 TRINITY_DN82810_c0_g1~~TRINITY_DN82810_c0_g1_i1.p1  ORF type:complete len:115 (+),score=31.90 TRINITY_DN82810_c0_g1_i1:3-347(+)